MTSKITINKKSLLLASIINLSLAASQGPGQVILMPSTITQPVTLAIGTPASEVIISVVRTGLVTLDVPGSDTISASVSIPIVIVTSNATETTPAANSPASAPVNVPANAFTLPFILPAEPALVTQAPCVSACLQQGLIASAAGSCGLSPGTTLDNACACLSSPLVAVQALANCAMAACTGAAGGAAGVAGGVMAVTSLYNDYCTTAVGAANVISAVASEQAVQATAAAGSSTTTTTTTSTMNTATPWSGGISSNATLTTDNGTLSTNETFGGGLTLTATPTFADPGITTGIVSTATGVDPAGAGTKSEANLDMPRKSERSAATVCLLYLCFPTDMYPVLLSRWCSH